MDEIKENELKENEEPTGTPHFVLEIQDSMLSISNTLDGTPKKEDELVS